MPYLYKGMCASERQGEKVFYCAYLPPPPLGFHLSLLKSFVFHELKSEQTMNIDCYKTVDGAFHVQV
jgi:hypothetical protein